MSAVVEAISKAIGQLRDPAVMRVMAKSLGLTLAIFMALGVGAYFALSWLIANYAYSSDGTLEAIAAVLLVMVSFWFLFRVIALAVLQFFADEVVAAVEARHYPDAAARAQPLPFAQDFANALKGIGRTIGVNLLALPVALVLLVTGVGPAIVFLGVNACLLGRELTDMAWLRHCEGVPKANPVPKAERLMLGGAVAGVMLVPFVNLIAPILGAAAGTHLAHNAMAHRAEGRSANG